MMFLFNILNISNNTTFYIIIVVLILISLLMFTMIYSQNKEIKTNLRKEQTTKQTVEPFNIYQDDTKKEEIPEKIISSEPLISEPKEKNTVQKENIFSNFPASISENPNNLYNDISSNIETNIVDTPIRDSYIEEEPELIELSDIPIPENLEYTQALWENDFLELQNISKELESTPKEHKIQMTPFEREQEEKAIISYDELINRTDSKNMDTKYYNEPQTNTFYEEKMNRNETNATHKTQTHPTTYEHEETFLHNLKELKDSLI